MPNTLIQNVRASMGIFDADDQEVYGLLAEFSDPHALMQAAEATHEAGYSHFDTHSPFPIHGMDDAMGLGQSKLGPIVFGGAVAGVSLGLWLQWWTGGVDYPLNISGKPFFALEPSVPVIFELTILFSALTAVIGMLALNGLPRPYNPIFNSSHIGRATDDAFFLHIAASDKHFDVEETAAFLREQGALDLELIEERENGRAVPTADEIQLEPVS